MSFILWDELTGSWRRTPQKVTVQPGDIRIDCQWQAEQGNWDQLTAWGIYEEWLSPEQAPLGYAVPVVENIDGRDRAARYPTGTQEEKDAANRQQLSSEIDAQVPNDSVRRLVEDPLFERQVEAYSGGASERKSELEDTPDANLDSFESTVIPTPANGTGFVEAKMTTFIDIVDPWAGAPQNIYALVCVVKITTPGEESDGEALRAHMFNEAGVDQGVLPFTQDPDDLAVWRTQSQEGRYWSDPAAKASMRLLWDSGALAVAETKLLNGFGDRQYAVVRAGLPEARGRKRR